MTNGLLIYSEIFCVFPHILGSPSSYMTLHPIPFEFPYIRGKICFLFYQCTDTCVRNLISLSHLYADIFTISYIAVALQLHTYLTWSLEVWVLTAFFCSHIVLYEGFFPSCRLWSYHFNRLRCSQSTPVPLLSHLKIIQPHTSTPPPWTN